MANWKKIIVSGSDAHLNNITASALDVNSLQVNNNSTLDGNLTVVGSTTLGQTTINGSATITGSATIQGNTITQGNNTVSGSLIVSQSITADTINGYHYLAQDYAVTHSIAVTVATQTEDHPYYNLGSSNKYVLDGQESPFLQLTEGVYKFDQSDSSNSGHPLAFYYDAAKSTSYSTNVSSSGIPGSAGAATYITVTPSTPTVLYYQCTAHAYMGWGVNTNTYTLTGKDTDDLNEGSTNLYYTDARVKTKLNAENVLSGSVHDGLTLTNVVASGSFSGSFTGDGSGLTGLATSLDVSGSNGSAGSVNLLTQDLTITGASNEIETSVSGQTVTIGLPDSVSITSNLTVGGDLYVEGTTTTINTANLLVEDKFILLNSGSANPDEGGLVIDEGSGQGHAFVYDADAARFAFTSSLDSTATSVTPDAYVPAIIDLNASHTDVAEYQKNGNLKIDTSGDIWIYS